jgi:hypothetical protein
MEGRAPHAPHDEIVAAETFPLQANGSRCDRSGLGRGGLRTPARKASRQPQHCPFWGHRPLANSCLIMTPSVYVQPCQTDAQSASLRENGPSCRPRPLPARLSVQGSASPRRGGLRTPAREASRQPQHCPFWGHRPLANSCLIMTPLGLRPALPNGRTECVPPRKRPLVSSPASPR